MCALVLELPVCKIVKSLVHYNLYYSRDIIEYNTVIEYSNSGAGSAAVVMTSSRSCFTFLYDTMSSFVLNIFSTPKVLNFISLIDEYYSN